MARQTQLADLLDTATTVSPEFLREAVADFQGALEHLQQDFEASLSHQEPELVEATGAQIEAVRGALQEQARLTAELAAHIKPDADLRSWASPVRAAARHTNDALAAYREAALIAYGPTGLAGVNLILRTADHLLEEESDGAWERLRGQVESEHNRSLYALAQSPDNAPLRETLGDMASVLRQLLVRADQRSLEGVQHLSGELVAAAEDLEAVLAELQARDELSEGPTPFARINLIMNLAREGAAEELLEASQLLQQDVGSWRSQCATIARRVATSPRIAEWAQAVDKMYEEFDQELVELYQAASRQELEAVEERGQLLGQLWEELTLAQKQLEKAIERQDQTPCVRCGHYNAQEKKNCEKCGAILPVSAQERSHAVNVDDAGRSQATGAEVAPTEMTENLQRILGAVEQFQQGRLPVEDLHAEVTWMTGLLQEARNLLPQPKGDPAPAEPASESVASPVGLYLEGLQDMEAGLAFLRQLHDPSDRNLSEMGTGLVWEGAGKVQRAMAEAAD